LTLPFSKIAAEAAEELHEHCRAERHDVCPPFHSARHHGGALYDEVPSNRSAGDPNSAAATGGGSLGYNQMLLID
jgi:hypothetical protein